jgi:proteasome lid subunit RPN8/RPN11
MLKIPPAELAALRRHGEETHPLECCGVLLGRLSPDGETRTVERAVRCTNQNTERGHDRYVIDPRDLVRIQREGRGVGLDIVGFYHSHPDSPARWSKTDLAEAHWLGCSYVITRVDQRVAQDTNAFVLLGTSEDDKHFEAEPLETAETAAVSEHRM